MSNRLNLADAINEAIHSGKDPTFTYNGTTYTFSPDGLIAFMAAAGYITEVPELPFSVPTTDPEAEGQVWNDEGVLKVSAGAA